MTTPAWVAARNGTSNITIGSPAGLMIPKLSFAGVLLTVGDRSRPAAAVP